MPAKSKTKARTRGNGRGKRTELNALAFLVPIETLAPEPFAIKKPFHVVVRPNDGEFLATLFDANLSITGDTAEEAVAALKATIVDTFDVFEANEQKLGPEPKQQLAVLRDLIQRK